eukprot:9219253-Lingulodinium_polyedra.AAC.1
MLLLETAGVRAHGMLLAVCQCVAYHVEVHVKMTAGGGQSSTEGLSKRQVRLNKSFMRKAKEELLRQVQHRILRYWMAGRRALGDAAMSVGLAVDASRLGGRSVTLGFLSTSANICMWAPPLVWASPVLSFWSILSAGSCVGLTCPHRS